MQDHIVRAITKDGFLKATAICSTGIAERARQIHHTTPTATAALGRVLTAASMMGNMQKVENGTLTLQIKGGGPLGTLLAVSDAEGNVRGYVQNPGITLLEKYAGKLDVGAAVGTDGMLTVIRDLQMKEPYVGSVALVSGEIGDGSGDLAHAADRAHGEIVLVAGASDQFAAGVIERTERFQLARGKLRIAGDSLVPIAFLLAFSRRLHTAVDGGGRLFRHAFRNLADGNSRHLQLHVDAVKERA